MRCPWPAAAGTSACRAGDARSSKFRTRPESDDRSMDARGEARTKAPTRSAALMLALCLLVVATLVGGVRAVALAGAASDNASTLQLDGASLRVTSVDEVVGIAAADLM